MFLKNSTNVEYDNNGNNKYKLPLIIIVGIILLIGIIFLIAKLFNNREIAYDDKLYYINLIGDNNVTIYLGEDYQDPGYNAMDEDGNDVTTKVAVTNSVDNNTIGSYKISYTLGNVTKERIVKVIAKPVGATYIHLYGDINTYLYVGETYQEKGYEVVDTVDGANLNSQVKVNSNVNTSKEGIYKVAYSVTNSGGVTTTQERTVIVMDRSLSLLPNINTLTNKNITINIYAKDELFSYLILPNNNKVTERISTYEVNSNGTYKFVMYNTKGEKTEKSVEITNIDKTKPSGSCSGYYKNNTSYITVNANDNVGINKYVINNTTYTTSNITINTTLTSVNVTIYDKAGNTVTASCKLENKNPSSSSSPSSSKPSSSTAPASSSKPTATPLNVKAGMYLKEYNGVDYYIIIPEGATTNMPLITHFIGGIPANYFSVPSSITNGTVANYVKSGNAYKYQKFIWIHPMYTVNNTNSYKKAKALIDYIANEYKCNKDKLIITGISNGALVTFWLANEYPGQFSAVVPFSGPVRSDIKAENFVNTSLWGITSSEGWDKSYYGTVNTLVSNIHKINPKAKAFSTNTNEQFRQVILSELGKEPSTLPNVKVYEHSTTIKLYEVPELWEWMLKQ